MKEITGIKTVVPRFIVRSLTNDGDMAKQYATVLKCDQFSPSRELVDFASYLSGHGEDTIRQMYGDWKRFKK